MGWLLIERNRAMRTAQGQDVFDLYEGTVSFDGVEYRIPVHVGEEIPDVLLGLQWLGMMRLVVDAPVGVLTLEHRRSNGS